MASLSVQVGWPSKKLSPNGRPNRFAKATAIRNAKAEGYLSTLSVKSPDFKFGPGRFKITIRAYPPTAWRTGDADNLVASCKAYLDGIASALGVDDKRFEAPVVDWRETVPNGRLMIEVEGDQ